MTTPPAITSSVVLTMKEAITETGPLVQANKNTRFIIGDGMSAGRHCQSPERSGAEGRGSEHRAVLGYAPRRAAQAGLTGGADRSLRLRRETNVRKEDPRHHVRIVWRPQYGNRKLFRSHFLLARGYPSHRLLVHCLGDYESEFSLRAILPFHPTVPVDFNRYRLSDGV